MAFRAIRTDAQPRQGAVLVAVLIVVVLLSLAVYQYNDLMQAEYRAADSYARATQARALADSGLNYVAMLLANQDAYNGTLGGNPYDNPSAFRDILLVDNNVARLRGRFSIISPLGVDEATNSSLPFRYGVTDECGKLNLNGLLKIDSSGETAKNMLMKLPNMTEEIANAILDWLDPDDDIRPGSAENETYTTLSRPYNCKNGPLETLEELLYVQGVTPQLLFGNDYNRNGIQDPDEQDGTSGLDLGWAAFLTVYGREQNVDGQGQPRIYVNDANTQTLYNTLLPVLGDVMTSYILAYRAYGPASSSSSGASSGGGNRGGASVQAVKVGTGAIPMDSLKLSTQARGRRLASLFELVGTSVQIPGQSQRDPATLYSCPLNDPTQMRQILPLMLEKLTTTKDTDLPARINILTAPRQVLLTLPSLEESDVDNIIAVRPSVLAQGATSDAVFQAAVQLVIDAGLTPDKMRAIERYITVRTQMYRVQVVGHFDSGGPAIRVEAIIDTNRGRPRIVYWRDLTELGRGFDLNQP